MLDAEGAIALLRRARTTDPSFFPAHAALITRYRDLPSALPAAPSSDDPSAACLGLAARTSRSYPAGDVPALLRLEDERGATVCTDYFLGTWLKGYTPRRAWLEDRITRLQRSLEAFPELTGARLHLVDALVRIGRVEEAEALLEAGLSLPSDPISRLWLQLERGTLLEDRGRERDARALRLALAAAVDRDGRAGLRYILPPGAVRSDGTLKPMAERQRLRAQIAQEAGSWRDELTALRGAGASLSDMGDQEAAIDALDRAVAIADSAGSRYMRMDVRRFRGRALMKAGRLAAAEKELRAAVRVGGETDEPFALAEVYHNLAHVYESAGELARAAAVVDSFIQLTQPLVHAQPRMMSLRDAGLIRWKAGWRAAANDAFEAMVRVVDEQERHRYWAGEHFERRGELERALAYYRLGLRDRIAEHSLNLAGITRVFTALGQLDSAEAHAREHDRVMRDQRDIPMLPAVLSRQGRSVEAAERLRTWTDQQAARSNLHGAALGALEGGRILLEGGHPTEAVAAAGRAERWARATNRIAVLTSALGLRGRGHLGAGRIDSALAVLESAARLTRRYPTPTTTFEVNLALGRALHRAGDLEGALRALDRAAGSVDALTHRLGAEVHRAGFRERHLAPFDDAVRLLLDGRPTSSRGPPPVTADEDRIDHLDRLLRWSHRRKAAVLGAIPAWREEAGRSGADRVSGLQRRLRPGAVLVDYLLGEGFAAALVLTRDRAAVVRLGADADSIASLARQIRRPLDAIYAGRLDLARARYDLVAARGLYRALVAPILDSFPDPRILEIVPDGPLHRVPFDALVTRLPGTGAADSYRTAEYLIDRVRIRTLPSAVHLPSGAISFARPGRVLAVAGDAPATEREVEAVRAAWPRALVRVFRDTRATEDAVLSGSRRYDLLHLATHAEADDRDPLASHLRLAAGGRHDGFLHLGEIVDTPWSARLVILSACQTQAGRLYAGSGLMSLTRAFLAGGADAVVATQWPVGPSTADVMADFHRALARGLPASAALRSAKLTLRSSSETAHPFHWASFLLVVGP